MSLKLENLPLEIIGALSELLLANEVCWLWLSGSKRLHYLLEHGVTCFHHLPARRQAYLWPSFISRFKRLQMAFITTHMAWNHDQLYRGIELAIIPRSVTTLKLDFANGFLTLFEPPSKDLTTQSMTIRAMPLSTMFPNLAHLDVHQASEPLNGWKKVIFAWEPILTLPLLSLRLSLGEAFPAELLKHISPTVTRLEISPMKGKVESFPPHLVALSIDSFYGSLATSILPSTLQRLKLHCKAKAEVQWQNWPFKLKFLDIAAFGLSLSHSDIKTLPQTLISLSMLLRSMPLISLHDLPQKLTFLFINYQRAFSTVSQDEWTYFEPKYLPRGLVKGSISYLTRQVPRDRLNSFPIGMPSRLVAMIDSIDGSDVYNRADSLIDLTWLPSEPEINWPFKNLKLLSFGIAVHPGQIYRTLPLLPLLEQLILGRHIEDPSLALNRINSPFFNRLRANCHPLSLCKWDKRWLKGVKYLTLQFDLRNVLPPQKEIDFLSSVGVRIHHLDEASINDIKAMDTIVWNDWSQFGGTRIKEDGEKVPFINWRLYAPLLPQSLLDFDVESSIEPMVDDPSSSLVSEWPSKRLESIEAFLPPHLWSCLPQGLETFKTCVESSDLFELARNLEQLPKRVYHISVDFIHPTQVNTIEDLPIFTKLLQERPFILHMVIGGKAMALPSISNFDPFTSAIKATFGHVPSI